MDANTTNNVVVLQQITQPQTNALINKLSNCDKWHDLDQTDLQHIAQITVMDYTATFETAINMIDNVDLADYIAITIKVKSGEVNVSTDEGKKAFISSMRGFANRVLLAHTVEGYIDANNLAWLSKARTNQYYTRNHIAADDEGNIKPELKAFEIDNIQANFKHYAKQQNVYKSIQQTLKQCKGKQFEELIRAITAHKDRYYTDTSYSLQPRADKLALLYPVPYEDIDDGTGEAPKLFEWVARSITKEDGQAGYEYLCKLAAYRCYKPTIPLPALILQGAGGTGKGIFSGLLTGLALGYYSTDSGFDVSTLNDTNSHSVVEKPNCLINEVQRTQADYKTVKRLVDHNASTVRLRKTGGDNPEVDNEFVFMICGNKKPKDPCVLGISSDPNSDECRRYSIFDSYTPIVKCISELESVSHAQALEMFEGEIAVLKANHAHYMGRLRHWLYNTFDPHNLKRPAAYHGISFKRAMTQAGYASINEICNHLFIDNKQQTFNLSKLYNMYKTYREKCYPTEPIRDQSQFLTGVEEFIAHNIGAKITKEKGYYLNGKSYNGNGVCYTMLVSSEPKERSVSDSWISMDYSGALSLVDIV